MSHKFSTALRNVPAGADLVGFATLQGVDPASPANLLEAHTSTRSSFARHEFGGVSHSLGSETSGLKDDLALLQSTVKDTENESHIAANPDVSLPSEREITQFSTVLRNIGPGYRKGSTEERMRRHLNEHSAVSSGATPK